MASKAGDVGDNGGMPYRGEVSRGGVEYTGGMKVWVCGPYPIHMPARLAINRKK